MSKKLNETPAYELAGLTMDLMSKIRNEVISITEFKKFLTMKSKERRNVFGVSSPEEQQNQFLKLISGKENIIIKSCDGQENLAGDRDFFLGGIGNGFRIWGLNNQGVPTKEISVEVHELVKDATFAQMFGSLGTDLDKLCLTQHQIKMFCKKSSGWLRTDERETFFLFKEKGQFFVAGVVIVPDGLCVGPYVEVYDLENVWVLRAKYAYLLVVPQQEL